MTTISLEEARKRVREFLSGSECVEPTPDQWRLLRHQHHHAVDAALKRKLEKAIEARALWDAQLSEADTWLRKNGFNYPIEEKKIVRYDAPTQRVTTIEIAPVFFDADAFEAALEAALDQPQTSNLGHFSNRAAGPAVRRKVESYISAERTAGRPVNEKNLWDWAKKEIPNATREQVLEAKDQLQPQRVGRPKSPK